MISKKLQVLFLSTLVASTSVAATPYVEVEDTSGLSILTPALSKRETAKIRLPNGLEALIISDPGVDQSGAALAVEVGSWQDPDERPGLAHFCEHMLFLGNAKYPEEAGFTGFLQENAGNRNAYTSDRTTNYMFAVNNESFPEALDRFSNFFIDPLFTASALSREVKAVNSEFSRTVINDQWREGMVRKSLARKEHPDSRFTCGNASTLGDVTSEEVRNWFQSHYSAQLMHVVVVSSLPIDELKQLTAEKFGQIPNRGVGPFPVTGEQHDAKTLGKMVLISPHLDQRQLSMVWEVPFQYDEACDSHAGQLLCSYLGYEGHGSLLQQLKDEGLAEALSAGFYEHRVPHTDTAQLYLSIHLTEKGLLQRDEVIERVFQTVELVRRKGLPDYFFREQQQMALLSFEYQSRQEVFATVQRHASMMVEEELASYPRKSLLAGNYSPKAIHALVEKLTPESCLFGLMVPPQEIEARLTQVEPWTRTEYELVSLPQSTLKKWAKAAPHPHITLPEPNRFIPEKLELVYKGATNDQIPHPELLVDNDFASIYWAVDRRFHVPELFSQFNIVSAAVDPADPRKAVLLDLTARAVTDKLGPTQYMALLAGHKFQVAPSWHGLMVTASGYSDKASELLTEIFRTIRTSRPSEEQFALYKDSLIRDYQNFDRQPPIAQAQELTQEVIYRDFTSHAEKERAILAIGYNDLIEFMNQLTEETYIKGVVYGNLTEQEGQELWNGLHKALQRRGFSAGATLRPEVVCLPDGRGPFFLEKRIHNQGIAVILAIQEGEFSFEKRAAQQILSMGIETPFFDELRTKQQTGYVCASADAEIEGELFQQFAVESTSHDPRDLLARFELMIEQFLRAMPELTFSAAKFDLIRNSLVTRLSQPPKNQVHMGQLLYLLAFDKRGDFDFLQKRIAAAQEMRYDQFLAYSHDFLGKGNKRRFAAIVLGELDRDQTLQYQRATSLRRLARLSRYGKQAGEVAECTSGTSSERYGR
jgi:insulysin